jgi:hypothetical protein
MSWFGGSSKPVDEDKAPAFPDIKFDDSGRLNKFSNLDYFKIKS